MFILEREVGVDNVRGLSFRHPFLEPMYPREAGTHICLEDIRLAARRPKHFFMREAKKAHFVILRKYVIAENVCRH